MSKGRRFLTFCLLLCALGMVGCSGEVKIGAVISRTGATGPYGQMVAKGIDLALEEVNAAGGFDGSPITLVYRDDESNAEVGVKAAEELISQEGTRLIIGAVSSTVTLSIAEVCQKKRVLLLSPTSSAPRISTAGDYIFRNYPSDIIEGTAMADFAKELGVRRVVIFAMDNEFGRGLTEVFRRQFESKSRKILETFDLDEGTSPEDLNEMVAQLDSLGPQGIYVIAYVNEMAALLQKIEEAGLEALVMGSGAVTEELSTMAGAPAVENFVYAQSSLDLESKKAGVESFVKAFREKYKQDPDVWAAHGYDSVKILVRAMEEGGMAHPDSVKLGLLNIEYEGAAGRSTFDERGDVTRYPQVFVFQQGEPLRWEKFREQGGSLDIPPY